MAYWVSLIAMDISVVVLNWNGLELLKECFPVLVSSLQGYPENYEIIVVDNASTDGSIKYLAVNFPEARVLTMTENLGFAKALNVGIKNAKYSVILCLNNDVIVRDNFLEPLIRHLKNENVFAAGPKMLMAGGEALNFGRTTGSFKYGFFTRKIFDCPHPGNSLYASAGCMVFKKDKFLELGGFDEDMDIYWEDLDLCYRAWKRGWRTVYEPESVIYHKFHATNIRKCGLKGIDSLSGRNYSFFVIKNIDDKFLLFKHVLFLPLLIIISFISGRGHFASGVIGSFGRMDIFWKKRRAEKNHPAIFLDRKILKSSAI